MLSDAILVLRQLTPDLSGWSLSLLLALLMLLRGLGDLARALFPQKSGDRLGLWYRLLDHWERRRSRPPARSRADAPDGEDDAGPRGGDPGDSGAR